MSAEPEAAKPNRAVDDVRKPSSDPSPNVLDLVEAGQKYQTAMLAASERRNDDLRTAAERLGNVKHAHQKEIGELRAKHAREMRQAEAARLDAIRAVDVAAAAITAERTAASAAVLGTQVVQTAEALRVQVASTAASAAQQADAANKQLSDRITLLERTSYEGSGKSAVADPMMARMVETLEQLRLGMADRQGREGLSTPLLMTLAAAVAGVAGFIIQAMLPGGAG